MAKRDLRKELFAAVCDVTAEIGLSNVTIKRAADRAKATETNVYYHFKNKEELFEFAFSEINKEIDAELRRCYVENRLDLNEDLCEASINIWFAYLDYWLTHPSKTLFYSEYSHSHYATNEIWYRQAESFAFFTALFQNVLHDMLDSTDVFTYQLKWSIIIGSTLSIAKRSIGSGVPVGEETRKNMRKILEDFLVLKK